ncbi:PREDICTED: uncharacterized protein LOC104746742 [Camelina sativa]|uniref:Uncharacterized protein LOC104746742 n=1 Tax=Camelina sativa TaxID=90675 RepID=A0ABM1QE47_CAMSA|nr:PREDICTED: uncharacterized protein LOC104746742 [Camelina sativa]
MTRATTPVMKKATPEVSVNRTFVFWDIKSFPVPPGFDPRRVRQCIQRLLKNYDYSGPVTIYVVGMITDVHDDILRALSSTGIILHYAPYGTSDIMSLMFECMEDNPPPANILGICYPRAFATPQSGFNLFRPFPYSSAQEDAISWINLILAVSGSLKHEDTFPETDESASWFCILCYDHPPGQGFDSFTSHLSSPEHVLTRNGHLTIGDNEPMSKFEDEDGKPSPIVWWRPMFCLPKSDPVRVKTSYQNFSFLTCVEAYPGRGCG